jgi:protein phosphatase
MTTRYVSAGQTVTGKVRKHNEDAILVRDEVGLWVVADGLGGHSAGDYASSMIVERLAALPRNGSAFDFIETIEDTLVQINADLLQTASIRGVDLIGSTVVVLVHDSEFMLCGWVGDSRAYCFEDNRLRQITRDHVHGGEDDITHFGATAAPCRRAAVRGLGGRRQSPGHRVRALFRRHQQGDVRCRARRRMPPQPATAGPHRQPVRARAEPCRARQHLRRRRTHPGMKLLQP